MPKNRKKKKTKKTKASSKSEFDDALDMELSSLNVSDNKTRDLDDSQFNVMLGSTGARIIPTTQGQVEEHKSEDKHDSDDNDEMVGGTTRIPTSHTMSAAFLIARPSFSGIRHMVYNSSVGDTFTFTDIDVTSSEYCVFCGNDATLKAHVFIEMFRFPRLSEELNGDRTTATPYFVPAEVSCCRECNITTKDCLDVAVTYCNDLVPDSKVASRMSALIKDEKGSANEVDSERSIEECLSDLKQSVCYSVYCAKPHRKLHGRGDLYYPRFLKGGVLSNLHHAQVYLMGHRYLAHGGLDRHQICDLILPLDPTVSVYRPFINVKALFVREAVRALRAKGKLTRKQAKDISDLQDAHMDLPKSYSLTAVNL
jgi:hypothetical protein